MTRDLEPGSAFAGRYAVVRLVGRGGMGSVYAVRDTEIDEHVALKVLSAERTEARGIARFRREVRLARRITHPNVVRTHDLGTADGLWYLTMELVSGDPLGLWARRAGTLTAAQVAGIGAQIAAGLAAAHAVGVVHRDLKPSNVLIDERGRAVLTDFGIARSLDGADGRLTRGPIGTPAYMAPEQAAAARQADARSDLYALGVVLFELITGLLPGAATPDGDALDADPRQYTEVPDPLAALVEQLLQPAPAARPSSATEVARALGALSDGPRTRTDPGVARSLGTASLVVAPLTFHGPPDRAWLADALREDLTDAATRVPSTKVFAPAATARFGADADPLDMARQLGAGLVLAGTLRQAGVELRLDARLIDAHSGEQRWSQRFQSAADEPFALQDTLTGRVLEALRVQLVVHSTASEVSPEAWDLYQQARALQRTAGYRAEGVAELAEQSFALAPDFGVAIGLAALARVRMLWGTPGRREVLQEAAIEAVARARRDAPRQPETLLASGMLALQQGRVGEAAAEAARALEIAPSYAAAATFLGGLECEADRTHEGRARLERAVQLNPAMTAAWLELARQHAMDRAWERSAACLASARSEDLPVIVAGARLGMWMGDPERVRSAQRSVPAADHTPGQLTALWFQTALGDADPEDLHWRAIGAIDMGSGDRYATLMEQLMAEVLCLTGRPDLGLEHVLRASAGILLDLGWLDRCPALEAVRDEPAFEGARRRVRVRVEDAWPR